jgi:hypothetical protein
LAELSDEEVERLARHHFDAMRQAEHHGLLEAKEAGSYLRERKRRLGHGGWIAWLRKNYRKSVDAAQDVMRISKYWSLVEPHLAEQPELSKTAALRIIRAALAPELEPPRPRVRLDPPPVWDMHGRVVFGPSGPLSADETKEEVMKRARADLVRKVSSELRNWPTPVAFLMLLEPVWRALDQELVLRAKELEQLAHVVDAICGRVYRRRRRENEFGYKLEAEGGQALSEKDFDEDLAWAVDQIPCPAPRSVRAAVIEILNLPIADDLRPFERQLLEDLLASPGAPIPPR